MVLTISISNTPGIVDVAGQREQPGAGGPPLAERGEGGPAVQHDPGQVGQGLDVVDHRRLAVEADGGREERRLDAGEAGLPSSDSSSAVSSPQMYDNRKSDLSSAPAAGFSVLARFSSHVARSGAAVPLRGMVARHAQLIAARRHSGLLRGAGQISILRKRCGRASALLNFNRPGNANGKPSERRRVGSSSVVPTSQGWEHLQRIVQPTVSARRDSDIHFQGSTERSG